MPATVFFDTIDIPRPPFINGGIWKLKDLQPISVLFGKNGSGKSLLLRGWRDLHPDTSHYIIPERTGDLSYSASLLEIQSDSAGRRQHSLGNFINEYRRHIIARIQAYFLARGAVRQGQLPGNVEDLEQFMSILLPDFELELIGGKPSYKLQRVEAQQSISRIEELSSGEAQILTLGLDILTMSAIWEIQNSQKRLMLIDEPDAHIHPDLQVRFADFLVQVANQYNLQIMVATHSTILLSALGQFGGTSCGVIYVDRTKTEFTSQQFTVSLKEVAACLGGHALMGPLFGVPLLLVEGDDDYRVWSQVPRHHIVSFAVIPCNGGEIDKYQRTLETIFTSLRDTPNGYAGYVLRDGDVHLPRPQLQATQDHMRYIGLKCHETENLYLTDEVLALMETNWDLAKVAIVAASGQHGNKENKLANAPNWNRQWEDVKDVINEISQAIDSKKVHWTQRVGQAIGRQKPTGQLADFLGESVINSLWK